MTIDLPNSLSAMRIRHANAVMNFKGDVNYVTIGQRVEFLRPFVKVDREALLKITADDINKMFKHVVECMAAYKYKEPPKYLKLNGIEYARVKDFGQGVPVALHIDVDQFKDRFKDQPELVAAFTYIEKGKEYAETDSSGAVTNSVFDRAEVFKEHLPLDVHLDIMAFFLRKSKRLIPAYMELQASRLRAMATNSTLGKV
jgi:hypothetical protein